MKKELTPGEVKELKALLRSKVNVAQLLQLVELYMQFDQQDRESPDPNWVPDDRDMLERLRIILRNPTGERKNGVADSDAGAHPSPRV